ERGCELDALWNDDYHHSVMVALTGRAEGYYSDFRGCPQELVSAAKSGFLYQGQESSWLHQRRGRPASGIWPARFVNYIQNHDQVANSAAGLRGHQLTSQARWRAMTALTLLLPGTPMLFQGQEFSASTPFFYFAEFDEALNEAIRKGRIEFLAQFPSIANTAAALSDPSDPATFQRSNLDFRDRERNAEAYALHRDLLQLRRTDLAFRQQRLDGVDGCVLSPSAFGLRFFTNDREEDRLVIVNLGSELSRPSIAEPLLAPPVDRDWAVRWSSNDPKYGGDGPPDLWPALGWRIPGETAIVLAPGHRREHERA